MYGTFERGFRATTHAFSARVLLTLLHGHLTLVFPIIVPTVK
jgi:hypothetical protein